MMDFRDNMQKCQEYVHGLEEEKRKIQVFQRELPLCLQLVTQAIEACKQQLSGTTTTTECVNGHSECSEQTASIGPVFEEFIPIKNTHFQQDYDDDDDDDEEEHECNKPQINNININTNTNKNNNDNDNNKSGKKSDWLRSVQLWNQSSDPSTNQEDYQPKKVQVVEVKSSVGGAFHPFQKEKNNCSNGLGNVNMNMSVNENSISKPTSLPAVSACSSAEAAVDGAGSGTRSGSGSGSGSGGGNKKEEKNGQSQRKSRRCWSPELHRRFLHALQQLGGSHAATPKQIRELMKVDGLTNDEVKSHLQKYRLHTRRPSSSVQNNTPPQTTQPHFVVVGGIWVPPPEYTAVTTSGDTTTTSPNGIYTPVATVASPPPLPQTSTAVIQKQQPKLSSHSSDKVCGRSNSPATSSSTHTTTASHAY